MCICECLPCRQYVSLIVTLPARRTATNQRTVQMSPPIRAATVAKRNSSPGRAKETVKTIAQGRPDDPAKPVVTTACLLPMHAGHGCGRAPGLPCALCLQRARDFRQSSGAIARRGENVCLGCLRFETGTKRRAPLSLHHSRRSWEEGSHRPWEKAREICIGRRDYTATVATTWASNCSRLACERVPFMVAAKRSRMPSSKAVTMVSWT